jgi:predicted TIM-barrel fold metal-dependent hydrolase
MIIDAHTHIIPAIDTLPREQVVSLGSKGVDVHQYLDTFSQLGIQACFTFSWNALYLDSYCRAENEALAKLNQRYPERLYAWGTVSPAWNEHRLRAEIRYAIQDLKLYGLKFVPICQGISLTNPGFDIVAQEAIDLGVPITTHDGSPEYCSAIQVAYYARKYPRLRVLSAHGGLRELWPDLIEAARSLPNLYICLSGPTQWGIQSLYDALGPEKLLFGSDGGCGPAAITSAYLRRIERLKAPAAHKDMILGGNALRFLKGW